MKRDHNLLRYLPWFARDAFVWPGRVFLVLLVLVPVIVWRFATNMKLPRHAVVGGNAFQPTGTAQLLMISILSTCITVAILMTIGGMPGTDFERGYYRSWFSKPMSAPWFYLQRFLMGAVVILLVPPLLGLGLMAALGGGSGLSWTIEGFVALYYLLIASASLLVSRFTARGWLVVFLVDVLQSLLKQVQATGYMPTWLEWIYKLLPPFQKLGLAIPMLHGADLWHVLGYGVGMLIAALALLRFRPLGAGVSA